MSVMLVLYMLYFMWKQHNPLVQLFNTIFPFTQSATIGTYLISLGFILLNITYRLLNEGINQSALKQAELGADSTIHTIANFIVSIPSHPNDWSWALKFLHFFLKSVATLVYLLLFMLYLFQHAIIISLLLGMRQLWRVYRAQIQRPGLPFEIVILFKFLNAEKFCANSLN